MSRRVSILARVVLTSILLMASTMFVAAQGPSQDGFVAVQPGQPGQEQLPATPLVFTAYAFVWVALLVYVLTLWRRLTRVERELVDVTARLEARRR